MKPRQLIGMALMMAAIAESGYKHSDRLVIEETDEEKQERLNQAKIKQNISKGLTKFEYGFGRIVWASNKKTADKKAKRYNWI